ncbi:MAG: thioredoxin fold domain-containing protein [Phycisphaerales bacterium]
MLRPVIVAVIALLLVGLLVYSQYTDPAAQPGIFSPLDFDQAQAEAARSTPPRLLIVAFVGQDCPACEHMAREAWSSPRLAEWVRGRALAIRIDRAADPGQARALGVQTIPATILLDGKSVLTTIEGEHSARSIIEKFDAALAARRQPDSNADAAPVSKAPRPDAANEPAHPPNSPP